MSILNKFNSQLGVTVGTILFLGGIWYYWKKKPVKDHDITSTNTEEFQIAAQQARKLGGLSQSDQLLLYGLYKQASFGDCNIKEPMRFNLQDHAKWEAWRNCKGISIEQAEQQYILLVNKFLDSGLGNGQQSSQMGMRVSTMKQGEHETNEAFIQKMNSTNQRIEQIQLSLEDQQQFKRIIQNLEDTEELERLLSHPNEFNLLQYENEQQIKLIHIIVDSENVEALKTVLPRYKHYNLVNIQESVSGMTPLHYACLSGNKEIVDLLLSNNADPKIKDFSGQDCFETIDRENRDWLQG